VFWLAALNSLKRSRMRMCRSRGGASAPSINWLDKKPHVGAVLKNPVASVTGGLS